MTIVNNSALCQWLARAWATLRAAWSTSVLGGGRAAAGRPSLASGSVLCGFFLRLWTLLRTLWGASALGGWCRRRALTLRRASRTSVLCDVVTRDGVLTRAWPSSLLGKGVRLVWDAPAALFRRLHRLAGGVWDGSLLLRGVAGVGQASWLLLGVFALVMLVAPHESWDNLYAFLGAAALFLLYCFCCGSRNRTLDAAQLGPYFGFYTVLITLGLVLSLSFSLSLRFFLFHLTCFFLVLLAVNAVERYGQLRALLVLAAIGLTVAAIYGCYQGYVGVEVVASQQDVELNAGMPGRIYSFFDNPNNFAELLVLFTPLVAALTLNARRWWSRILGLAALGVSIAAILLTYSRSSWLGLVLAVVVFLGLLNWRTLPALVLVGLCAVPLLPQTIWNRILTIGNMQDSSARYRIAIYKASGRLLRDYGLKGVGLGSDVMKGVFKQYPTLYDGNYPIHTHNNYFQMWGEVGIFGLLTYLAMVVGHIKSGLRAFRKADPPLRRILAAAIGGLVGISAVSLVEYTWFYPRNMFLFWLLFGVIAACIKLAARRAPAPAD